MFIYHFHRLVRHRLIWAGFAIVVSLMFLSVGQCYSTDTAANRVARVGARNVSHETYAAAERQVRGYGRNRDNATPAAVVATQVWERIAARQVAEELRLGATPREIREVVREVPAFAPQGTFDPASYRKVLGEALGLAPAQYEEYLGEQIAMHKLAAVVDSAAWIAPVELNDELAAWTDELTVRYAVLSNRFAEAPLPLDDAKLRAYYDEHRASFALPNRVAVHYAALPVSNFLDRVTVPEDEVRAYYDDHADKFVRAAASNATETMTLAESRTQIVAVLRHDFARQAAATNLANTFLDLAIKGGDRGFAAAAQAFGLTVRQTPLFGADDEIPEIENAREFRETAFDLDPAQPEGRYSVARGTEHVYALAAWTNSPAHQPDFEECLDRVRPPALAKARRDAFREQADAVRNDLLKALKAGQSFETASRAQALNVSTSLTFSAQSALRSTIENGMTVIQGALHLQPGELSEPRYLDAAAAGVLFVHVEARRPGDPLAAEMLRSQVRESLARSRTAALLSAWLRWNLAHRGLTVSPKMAGDLAASGPARDD